MSLIMALAISIGGLGGIATFLVFGPLAAVNLQIWAIFIAWACFYHCGGKDAGLRNTIVHTVFGAIMAWIALLLVTQIPLADSIGLPLWAGICVGVTVFVLVLAASNAALSIIPASVYGYAATAAYGLLGTKLDTLTQPSMHNPLIVIAVSLVVGAVLGFVSEKIAGALAAPAVAKA
ncbi:MAG: DUF1097 domain-containing protein [Alphaproteobacteria bacterium]|nr:DUF1097 domain-containing protein [Alphaproteobacteria bacterium]